MSEHFDIAIIGTGPGGYVAALKAAQMGAKVGIAEKSHLGGTCLNNGCIPSKALLASAGLMHNIEKAGQLGVKIDGKVSFDWAAIQKRKDKILLKLRGGIGALFKAGKIQLLSGRAKLASPGKFSLASPDGKSEQFSADKTIIAVGSVPARIPTWPDDPNIICTSDEALHWKDLPKRLLIVGGGVIGCEFACMMQPLGVEVTIVEMLPSLLAEMDAEMGDALAALLTKRGIRCLTDTKVADLAVAGNAVTATLSDGQKIEADRVLVATGRRAATVDVGLETIGLDPQENRGFIAVNDMMETAIKGYYCIGDANGRCLLAHAASAQGITAVENALGERRQAKPDNPVPWCVYTFPEIAGVGLTDRQARSRGIPISVGNFPIGHLGKAMAAGHADGFVKVIRHRETDALLGVQMMGHNVTECIGAATVAISSGATTHDLAQTIFAHPTISEAIKESAEDALGAAVHLPPRKILRIAAEA